MSSGSEKYVLIRDLLIFQLKLLLDGLKDFGVFWMAIGATALDLLFPGERRGRRFYAVMRAAERFDQWLNLYGAAQHAEENDDGLFGESAAGSASMLGRLEEIVIGRRETDGART
jgi:hypothetical protein